MARFNPDFEVAKIYPIVQRWRDECLLADGSLFSERPLWTLANINELVRAFVRNPLDSPKAGFIDKLKTQLSSCTSDVTQLMAEFLYVLLLFQSNMRGPTKRELVRDVWSWSENTLPPNHPFLDDSALSGIGSPGPGYMMHRWRELAYFIELAAAFKREPSREALIANADEFAKWVDAFPTQGYRQFRNILLHLVFPDDFERITVQWHKREIVETFGGLSQDRLKSASDYDLDLALRKVREKLAAERGSPDVDFYDDVLYPQWQPQESAAPTMPSPQAWLLSWNPSRWSWSSFPQDRLTTARGGTVQQSWTCANSNAAPGNRVFLVRAGEEPRGIIARGTVLSAPYETKHYDASRAASGAVQFAIDVEFDDIRDPQQDEFLRAGDLEKLAGGQYWTPQSSGIEIRTEAIAPLEEAWSKLQKPALDAAAPTRAEMAHPYTVDDIFADGCFHSASVIEAILDSWRSKRNLVLQGPPGTGKTWLAKRLAYALIGFKDDRRIVHVQFHPNLSYEDFVRGWRPIGNGTLQLVDGVFLDGVTAAHAEPALPYIVVIEEINRGNPAQIFGEILTLMEDSKREKDEAMRLAYPRDPNERVHVPKNLYVIGTMNVADRSLALVDLALRRRFAFVDLDPQFNDRWEKCLIEQFGFTGALVKELRKRIEVLNQQIAGDDRLGPQFRVGHSYLTPADAVDDGKAWFRQVVATQIAPLLREYWFDDKAAKAEKAYENLLKDL